MSRRDRVQVRLLSYEKRKSYNFTLYRILILAAPKQSLNSLNPFLIQFLNAPQSIEVLRDYPQTFTDVHIEVLGSLQDEATGVDWAGAVAGAMALLD